MRNLLFLLATFFSLAGFAQRPIIQDDFAANRFGWEESATCSLTNGEYIINSTEEGDESFLNFFIDQQKDFVISAEVNQKNGLNDNGFGILWGSSSENLNLFVISSQGDYAIYHGDPALL
jgi:hypothetical protein